MRQVRWLAMAVLLVSGCVNADSLTGQQVLDAFKAADIKLENIKDETAETRKSESPLPKSFSENWAFSDPVLTNGKGGQIFVCDEAKLCDAIYAYYDVLKGLAGPYLYKGADGRVVAQLNSSHTPERAKQYEDVLRGL